MACTCDRSGQEKCEEHGLKAMKKQLAHIQRLVVRAIDCEVFSNRSRTESGMKALGYLRQIRQLSKP